MNILSINRVHRFQIDGVCCESNVNGHFGPQLHELDYKVIEREHTPGKTRIVLQSHCVTGRGWLLPRLQVQYTVQDKRVYTDFDVKSNLLFSVFVHFLCSLLIIFGLVGPLFTMSEIGYPWFFPIWGGFVSAIMLVWSRYLSRRVLNKLITDKYIEQVYIRFAAASVENQAV